MSSTVEQIKERIGIVDVVSSYVKLEKAGKAFKARCPFHTEKTPSFFVSPERETYHCFGCGKGGDIFSFVEEVEGLDFSGALKVLADRAGVSIPRFDSKTEDKKKRLYGVLDEATIFFESQLREHKEVGEYLKSRGLLGVTAKLWRLGYALPEWRALYAFLESNNFTDTEMADTGLTNTKESKTYDRFRGRIMFPIMDPSGRVVAYSGRVFGEQKGDASAAAKYINSPETVLYDKSKILYGFDKAKMAIRKKDSCIVVEGQMDVIMSHQAGFQNTVAASGTALTEGHLSLIGRLTKNITLAFDADEAGFRAMKRGIELALAGGFGVRIAHLPEGFDPADMVKQDEKKWGDFVEGAKHVIEFYLDMFAQTYDDMRMLRLKTEEFVVPFIARIKSFTEQDHFVKLTAEKIRVEENTIRRAVEHYKNTQSVSQKRERALPEKEFVLNAQNPEERRLLGIDNRLLGIFLWQKKEKTSLLPLDAFAKKYEDITEKKIEDSAAAASEEEKNRLMFEAEAAHQNSKNINATAEELFNNLREQTLKIKLIFAMDLVKDAQKSGEKDKEKKAFSEVDALSKKIKELSASKK